MSLELWSKRSGAYRYESLFENPPESLQIEYDKWNQQLLNSEWNHRFLFMQLDAAKDPSISNEFSVKGNWYFVQNEFRKAMELYNQALRFVEIDSTAQAILYAKRGFCFANKKMYAEAIVDLNLALSTDFPSEWKAIVIETIEISRHMIAIRTKSPTKIVPELYFESDRLFPSMANVLQIKFNGEGRPCGIEAKVDMNWGTTIVVEEAFTSITNDYDRTTCTTCSRVLKNFVPCSGCVDAMFCSDECRDRNNIHKLICGHKCNRMPSDVQFIVQSILMAISLFPTVEQLIQFVDWQIHPHLNHTTPKYLRLNLDDKDLLNYGLFLKLSTRNGLPNLLVYQAFTALMSISSIKNNFNTRSKETFLMHLIGHHTMILKCNSFGGFQPNQSQFISAIMANVIALFEHSCTPNVMHLTHGNREICITLRPIKAGERLCYDYWPDDDDEPVDRKRILQTYFGIDCRCMKCCGSGNASNPELAADLSFQFLLANKNPLDDELRLKLCMQAFDEVVRNYDDETKWSKEMECVIKLYDQWLRNFFF